MSTDRLSSLASSFQIQRALLKPALLKPALLKRTLLQLVLLQLLILGLPGLCTAAPSADVATIQGTVEPLPSSGMLHLENFDVATLDYTPFRQIPVDATGSFEFELAISEPDLWRLKAGKLSAYLTIDRPEEVRVHLRARSAGGVQIEGSTGNARLDAFGELLERRNRHYFDDLKSRGEVAVQGGDTALLESMEAERDTRLQSFYLDLRAGLDAMGDSAAVLGALRYFDIYKQRRLFVALRDVSAARRPGSKVARALDRQLEMAAAADAGAMAPNFTLQDRAGHGVTLEDYRGRWVFVDFWASWCLNCRLEMPRVSAIHEDFEEAGFVWLGVTPRDVRKAWLDTLDTTQIPGTHLWDGDNTVADAYQVGGQLPATFLIDPEGRIVMRNLNAVELREQLEDYLGDRRESAE